MSKKDENEKLTETTGEIKLSDEQLDNATGGNTSYRNDHNCYACKSPFISSAAEFKKYNEGRCTCRFFNIKNEYLGKVSCSNCWNFIYTLALI